MNIWNHEILLILGALGLVAILVAQIVGRLRIPPVSAFLGLGLAIGPLGLGLCDHSQVLGLETFSELALGALAFTVGLRLTPKVFSELGPRGVLLAVIEGLATASLVTVGVGGFTGSWREGALLGAIAVAAAPRLLSRAVRRSRAAGPLCNTACRVATLDDLLGLVLFGLVLAAARVEPGTSSWMAGAAVAWELLGSVAIGLGLGAGLGKVAEKLDQGQIPLLLGGLVLAVGYSMEAGLSPLLTAASLGAALMHVAPRWGRKMASAESVYDTFYVIFFTLAGASLTPGSLQHVGIVSLVYVVLRLLARLGGGALGSQLSRSPDQVGRGLGLSLMPQTGFAAAMGILAMFRMPDVGTRVAGVVLGSVVVFEVLGPLCTKLALSRAGEVGRAVAFATVPGNQRREK